MIRSTIAALAIIGSVAGVTATAQADTDPCDAVPAAQDRLSVATSQWQVASASYDIANEHGLPQRYKLYENVKRERLQYAKAIQAYDDARAACAK